MNTDPSQRSLCMIELVATGRADQCPGPECPYWENGCVLTRVERDLAGRQDVAELLLEVRRELETSQQGAGEDALSNFHRRLSAGCE